MFKAEKNPPKERTSWAYVVLGFVALVGADLLLDDQKFDIQNK